MRYVTIILNRCNVKIYLHIVWHRVRVMSSVKGGTVQGSVLTVQFVSGGGVAVVIKN